ncbi:MAG: thiamine-phosphate kinase [Gammaproteobacteria bacterium]
MSLSEFEIIQQVFQQETIDRQDILLGIGDDAAVVKAPNGSELAITTDTMIAGVHFPIDMKPCDIGYRALAVNLSDLAAMGAEPAWITLALTIPESNQTWLKAFASGLFGLANNYNIQLIGGDTTRGSLSITIQAFGFIPDGEGLKRSGANVGDLVYVTGTLGDAAAGLKFWSEDSQNSKWLKQRLARPTPRVEAGLFLRNIASSAIDISDGFVADLTHILSASGVGAQIIVDQVPLSLALCAELEMELEKAVNIGSEMALSGGDDYELCFTVPADKIDLLKDLRSICQIVKVGSIVSEPSLQCISKDGSLYNIESAGYQHF